MKTCVSVILFCLCFSTAKPQRFSKKFFDYINLYVKYANFTAGGVSETQNFIGASTNLPRWEKEGKTKGFIGSLHFTKSNFTDTQEYGYINSLHAYKKITEQKELNKVCDTLHNVYNRIINKAALLKKHIAYKQFREDTFKIFDEYVNELEYLYARYDTTLRNFRKEINNIADKALQNDPDNFYRIYDKQMRDFLDNQLTIFNDWYIYFYDSYFPYETFEKNYRETEELQKVHVEEPKVDKYVHYRYHRFYYYFRNDIQNAKKEYLDKSNAGDTTFHSNSIYYKLHNIVNIRCAYEHDQYVRKCAAIKQYMIYYVRQATIFKVRNKPKTPKITVDQMYESMEGFADNHLILLLDVSGSMNSANKLPLIKKSFNRLLNILRENDKVSIIIYSGKAKVALNPISCNEKDKIRKVLKSLKSGGETNLEKGLKLAYKAGKTGFIQNGNNRIILATDGVFEKNEEYFELINNISNLGIVLSIFHFSTNYEVLYLKEMSTAGKGNYEIITPENLDLKLIKEAKAISEKNN